jgi:hypothetical protein
VYTNGAEEVTPSSKPGYLNGTDINLRIDGARDFNGTSDKVNFDSAGNLTAHALTLAGWIYLHSLSNTAYLLHIASATDDIGIQFTILEAYFQFARKGATTGYRRSNSVLLLGQWYHVLATSDGSLNYTTYHLYIDGVNNDTSTGVNCVTETTVTGKWTLGGRPLDEARDFNGLIGEISGWNRVLTTDEITYLASGTKSATFIPDGLLFCVHPDEPINLVTGASGTLIGTSLVYGPDLDIFAYTNKAAYLQGQSIGITSKSAYLQGGIEVRSGGNSYKEDFTGAEGELTGNWTNFRDFAGVRKDGTGEGYCNVDNADFISIYAGGTFSDNQYSQVILKDNPTTNEVALVVRGNPTGKLYEAYLSAGGDSGFVWWVDNDGNWYQIYYIGGLGYTLATGDVIRLEINGWTLTYKVNGVTAFAYTDSSHHVPSGNAGINIYDNTITCDDWEAGSLDNPHAYLEGAVAGTEISSSCLTYLVGQDSAISNNGVYLVGQDVANLSKPAYLVGGIVTSGSKPTYLCGQTLVTASKPVCLYGRVNIAVSKPAFAQGYSANVSSVPVYTKGSTSGVSSKPVYLYGELASSKPAFTKGGIVSANSKSAYLCGQNYIPRHTAPSITDNFNRETLDSDWTIVSGNPFISSNQLTVPPSENSKLFWNVDSLSNDQYVEAKQYTTAGWRGVVVRATGSIETNYTAYVAWISGATSGISLRIGWHNATTGWGAYLDASGTTTNCPSGSILRLEAIGQTPNIVLTVYIDGTVVKTLKQSEFTNPSAILNSGKAGLYFYTSSPAAIQDNFACGSISKYYQYSYLRGSLDTQSVIQAYLCGKSVTQTLVSAFVTGGLLVTDSQSAFTKGRVSVTTSVSAFAEGGSVTESSKSAYAHGSVTLDTSVHADLTGGLITSSLKHAYIPVDVKVQASTTAYTNGYSANISATPAYTRGQLSTLSFKPSYMTGGGVPVSSKSAYLKGLDTTLTSKPVYLHGQLTTETTTPSYICGKSVTTSNKPVFLLGGIVETTTQPVFVNGAVIATTIKHGYLGGYSPNASSQPAYLCGGTINVKHAFLNGWAAEPIYLHGMFIIVYNMNSDFRYMENLRGNFKWEEDFNATFTKPHNLKGGFTEIVALSGTTA